jgi:hypothetical protein
MKNLFKALAEFQQEVPTIHKGTKGYGYTYADLPTIFEKINPLLKKHGLGFYQTLESFDGEQYIHTVIFHVESGETIDSKVAIPKVSLKGMNDYQSFGSGVTYYRRYAISSALGLVTDVDNDASGEQESKEDKPWLNEQTKEWDAVMKAIEDGKVKDLAIVKSKYKLSKAVAKVLTEYIKEVSTQH